MSRRQVNFDPDLCTNLSEIYLSNLSDAETNVFMAGLVLNILSSIISVIMNAMIFHILLKISEVYDKVHPILCSICGAGLFAAIVVQPLHVVNNYLDPKVFQQIWPCHKIPAVIFAAAFHLTGYGVLGSLALLSFYHLQAVSDPTKFRTRYTTKKSRKHVAYLWISEIIVTFGSQGIFWDDTRVPDLLFYAGMSILVITVIVFQLWTFISLKIHNRNMLSPETDSLQVALVVKRAKKMFKTSAMIFVALVILCLPVAMAAVVILDNSKRDQAAGKSAKDRNTTEKTLLINMKILTFLFPAVYPFILLFMNRKFAKAAATLVKKIRCSVRKSRTVNVTVAPAGQVTENVILEVRTKR